MVTLADTSAWVEYDRATGSPVHLRVRELVERGAGLAVTEPVVMEVLAGARSERREGELRRLLDRCDLLTVTAEKDFVDAARAYRRCRRAGVTPRGLVDCLIAVVALRRGARLLAQDVDLVRVAGVLGLPLDPVTR